MPEIGEIKRAREIDKTGGYKGVGKYIWVACIRCGKERWVHLSHGKPESLKCIKHNGENQVGLRHKCWKGGRIENTAGYILLKLEPNDFFISMASKSRYVREHRLVMAKSLRRCLHSWELVHHKGIRYPLRSKENRQDNQLDNLQLVSDDRHKQITILENRIQLLEQRVLQLEIENIGLRQSAGRD